MNIYNNTRVFLRIFLKCHSQSPYQYRTQVS
ncbi:hypothetical protein [Scopulibacillus darangshiensis]